MTGSPGARATAAELRRRFEELGYRTREMAFSFSTLPGRYGLSGAGVVLVLAGIASGRLLTRANPGAALIALVAGLALAALPLAALAPALRRLPWGRVKTANLLFTRDEPRWIVMAHRDTKSQWVPTLVRMLALAAALAAWVALAGLSATGLAAGPGPDPVTAWVAAGVLIAAGTVLGLSPAGNASPGALDNGTGLAALLALAARVPPDVGFLVTDGEELGLAGARAAATQLPEAAGVINLDGLDDHGPIRIAEPRFRRRRAATGAVAASLMEAAATLGLEAVRRPLPPSILVDHEPLAAAGLPALTVLKGRLRSLLRVHRPGDTPDRLSGDGAAEVVTLVAAALGRPGPAQP